MILAALVAVIWGVNFVVSAIFVDHMPPMLFAAIRFTFVVFPAILFVPRPGIGWRKTFGVGFFIGVMQFGLMFIAMRLGMSGGLASLLIQLQTLFTVLLAAAFLAERPTRKQVLGIALGLVGLAVVGMGRGGAAMLPFLMMVAAAFFWGCGNVVMRSAKTKSGLSLTVWSGTVAPLPMFAASYLFDGPDAISAALSQINWWFIVGMFYTAIIATLVGFAVWSRLLARYPAGLVVPWSLVTPPAGIVTAILVRGEYPTVLEVVGAVIIILAVLLTTLNLRSLRLRWTP
ncbi:O-acetylserine/cysteine efflux transporter [Antricoccus suffuscus]|uniref:O-acetylserine/cysteine efflux transporter n=2 Tax=Antricoccus suffuscus TaxID=1629062 RepID=A0A2T0Z019_9ACTN|nr:O-acetylserine/cysteine efflux transporter [Antricoccus suffuscus]